MPTPKQIAANRLNAQHSAGPTSDEGKRASSMNALKSGLDAKSQVVPGESPEEFAQLQTELYDFHAPVTPDEREQVDNLLRNEWYQRRLFRIEAQLWVYHASQATQGTGVGLAEALHKNDTVYNRLWRRQQAVDKAHREAKAQLERLKRIRCDRAVNPLEAASAPEAQCCPANGQSQETTAETPKLGSFLHPAPMSFSPDNPVVELYRQYQERMRKIGAIPPVSQESAPIAVAAGQ